MFFLIVKATDRTNYSIEAFILFFQHDFIFTQRMKQQLVWKRTVNVQGHPGKKHTMRLIGLAVKVPWLGRCGPILVLAAWTGFENAALTL